MEELLESLPGPMKLDSSIVVIGILFLVLLVILNKLIYQPLTAILEERKRRIDEGDHARRSSMKTVEDSLATYQSRLVEARKSAQLKRAKILKESEMVREEMLSSAREQAFALVQAAVTEIDSQVNQAKVSLKAESETISKQIVASLLARVNA